MDESILPNDIQVEILLRLPLKSLVECTNVCRKWKSMICGEGFKKRYVELSTKRAMGPTTPLSVFEGCLDHHGNYEISEPILGVVLVHSLASSALCNPVINKAVPLPYLDVIPVGGGCYFGYDEGTREYKVVWSGSTGDYLVYTLRSDRKESWRHIGCDHFHYPLTNGICKRGFLYYGAQSSPSLRATIMRFQLSTEQYFWTSLPEGETIDDEGHSTMVNYKGKVGLVLNSAKELHDAGRFRIYVLSNEDSGEWELQHVVIPGWRENVGNDMLFRFVGTIGTGVLVFKGPASLVDGSESVLHYNTDPPRGSSGFDWLTVDAENGGSHDYVRACFNHFYPLLPTIIN